VFFTAVHEGEFIVQFPLVPGHEFTGEIAEVGANVSHLRVSETAWWSTT
jgi:D-arabinitol dehydrogenase (NADP+)